MAVSLRRRALLTLILTVLVVTGVLVAAKVIGLRAATALDTLTVSPIDAPAADSAQCAALLAAMPATVAGLPRRTLTAPVAGVAAWGDPAVTVRCGIDDPAELTCAAQLVAVTVADRTVQWLHIPGAGASTYVAVDRPVRLAVTIPDGAPAAVIQELTAVAGTAPGRPVCTNGQLNPARG